MLKHWPIIISILLFQVGYSQDGIPFYEDVKFYVHGNSILVGNNILGDHSSIPLMDIDVSNDKVKMEYIDVDDDDRTFSSSQATVNVAENGLKIIYAGLYWSALYPYEHGVIRKSGNRMVHKGQGDRELNVNSILFKTPNDDYETINGEIIFDSYGTDAFSTNVPYACYADVTSKLQGLSELNGTYTIANIRAAEGNISGGSSAGWLLYIIYEDPRQPPKYFTTYKGFVEVNDEVVEITFKDFKTKEKGAINTTIALATLEGDRKFKTDECSIYNAKTDAFENIDNALRQDKNFFNSSITIHSEMYTERNPNSTNTLGFDLLKAEIPNFENKIIDGGTTEAILQFQTKADRFYLFFVAFETEINQVFYQEKRELGALDITEESVSNVVKETNQVTTQSESIPSILSHEVVGTSVDIEKGKLDNKNVEIMQIVAKKSITIPSLASGYYLVTNVFSNVDNAKRWVAFLKEKGYSPKTYINPKNNWHYIYIYSNLDPNLVIDRRDEIKKLDYFKEIWIIKINLN